MMVVLRLPHLVLPDVGHDHGVAVPGGAPEIVDHMRGIEVSVIRQELQTFIAGELRKQGYSQVFTPHIGRLSLYKTSGHFPYYKESQYPAIIERDELDKYMTEDELTGLTGECA